jgi:DNA mismatch repair ATPase MutS
MTKKVFKVLQFIPLLLVATFIVSQKGIWLLFAGLFFLSNFILHYRNKQILFAYLYSIPQFLKMVFIAGKLSSETPLEKICPDIKIRLLSLQPLVRSLARFKFDVKLESEMAAIVWSIKELINIFFLSEPNTLFRTFRIIDAKKTDIEAVFAYVGRIDMLLSVVHLQESLPYYCKPQWTDEDLQMTDIYHPLIEECIPNTLNTIGKSVLLTGSNMSGKTTFIRTIALNMLSAQTLDMCFARSFKGRRMRIHSAISLHDNLLESQSFYMKEVLSVKDMLEKSQQCENNLFILDEIFKGTNTPERIGASKAVLSVLAGNRNMVFVSTHDIKLAELLAEEYELYHFCEQIEQNQLHFDYLLKQGKLRHRNAIRLLEIEGYPENVISEANKIAGKL